MNKLSTQCMHEPAGKETEMQEVKTSPRKQTLDFLKRFARAYHAEPTIQEDLCGYVLN